VREAHVKDLVEFIARSLVDEPDAVAAIERAGAHGSVVELSVAPEDLGKVIGRQGRTARSLRTIVAAAGAKVRKRIVLEILE
jgi:predicted RNA-binding protein YlqC (UPF0109 family)